MSVKRRTKNFTPEEVTLLIDEVEKRRHILFGPLKGPNLTQFHRDRGWDQVLTCVNAVAPVPRKIEELKRKLKDMKTRTKSKANAVVRESRRTGGGPNNAPPLSEIEQKVLNFLGTESVEGVQGGVDTYRKKVVNERLQKSSSPVLPYDLTTIIPPPPNFASQQLPTDPGPLRYQLSPDPSSASTRPGPSVRSPPPIPSKKCRKRAKTQALDELKKQTIIHQEANNLLERIANTLDAFSTEFLALKRREVECMEQSLKKKSTH